ncbi:hypothetical protein HDU80_001502, partial [Chytriomyces hyalinus]
QSQGTACSGSVVESLHQSRLSHTDKRTDYYQTYQPRVKLASIRLNDGDLKAIETLICAATETPSLSTEDYFNLVQLTGNSFQSMKYNHDHAQDQYARRAKTAEERYQSILNVDLMESYVQYKTGVTDKYLPGWSSLDVSSIPCQSCFGHLRKPGCSMCQLCWLKSENAQPIEILQIILKHGQFRENQEAAINSIIHYSLPVVIRKATGGGKSTCYEIPAILSPRDRIFIVVCPLIALVKGHHLKCISNGLKSAFLCSEIHAQDKKKMMQDIANNNLDLLFTTPESCISRNFEALLEELYVNGIKFTFVFDEAHCFTDWPGGDRDSYRSVAVLTQKFAGSHLVFMSATLAEDSISEILSLFHPGMSIAYTEHTDKKLLPDNLNFEILSISTKKIEVMSNWIKNLPFDKHGLVYTQTAKEADNLAD